MIPKKDLLAGATAIAQALGNPGRLELVELLAQRTFTVTDLAETAHMNIKTASAHLQVLKTSGLVTSQREATSTSYSLNDAAALLLAQLYSAAYALDATTRELHSQSLPPGVELVEFDDLPRLAPHTILDVRPAAEYDAGHIDGAMNVPVEDVHARMASVPADHMVLVYCRGPFCLLAHRAAAVAVAQGRQVAVVSSGGVGLRSKHYAHS